MTDNNFVDGMFAKEPHANAPDFVKCKISLKRKDLGNWLRGQTEDWINLDVKVSKNGKWYVAIDDWKPDPNKASQDTPPAYQPPPEGVDPDDDIPF